MPQLGFEPGNTTKRAAADPGLRPKGHGDQPLKCCPVKMDNSVEIGYGLDDLFFDSR